MDAVCGSRVDASAARHCWVPSRRDRADAGASMIRQMCSLSEPAGFVYRSQVWLTSEFAYSHGGRCRVVLAVPTLQTACAAGFRSRHLPPRSQSCRLTRRHGVLMLPHARLTMEYGGTGMCRRLPTMRCAHRRRPCRRLLSEVNSAWYTPLRSACDEASHSLMLAQ